MSFITSVHTQSWIRTCTIKTFSLQYYHVVSLLHATTTPPPHVTTTKTTTTTKKKSSPVKPLDDVDVGKDLGLKLCVKNDLSKALYLIASVEVAGKQKHKQNAQLLEVGGMSINDILFILFPNKNPYPPITRGRFFHASIIPISSLLLNREAGIRLGYLHTGIPFSCLNFLA